MGNSDFVRWDAPRRASLSPLADEGLVVSVRIAPQPGAATISPDNGVVPHVVYIPDRAPTGTGAMQEWDPSTGALGRIIGDRPRSLVKTSFSNRRPEYMIDLGVSFLAPWAGQIFIEGGTVAAGQSSPQDIEVVISRPELFGEMISAFAVDNPITSHRLSIRGQRPLKYPTITYVNVGTAQIPLPLGAIEMLVSDVYNIDITANGTTATIPTRNGVVPVGWAAGAGGSFAANAGTIPQVAFTIGLA